MADFNRYQTVLSVVQDAMGDLGLVRPTAVMASNDNTVMQMRSLLKTAGQELLEREDWQLFEVDWPLTTTPPTKIYDLPDDFNGFINDTFWNNTSRFPVVGPLEPQAWRQVTARNLGGTTIALLYRMLGDKIEFYYVPTAAQTLYLTYHSRGWVRDAISPTTLRDYPSADADVVLIPPLVIKHLLRKKWREAKGFDSTAATQDFEVALATALSRDRIATKLRLVRTGGYPLLTELNIPYTGYGP